MKNVAIAAIFILISLLLVSPVFGAFPPPVVNFTSNVTTACLYDVIQFNDTSVYYGVPTFFWEFGDSQDSHLENPTHYYDTSGTYDIYHTVLDEWGSGFIEKIGYITVLDCFNANFTSNQTCQIGKPLSVLFTSGCAEPDKSHWIFGNGNTSELQNDVATYTEYGSYNVTHTCKDDITQVILSETKIDYISVGVNGTYCSGGCSSSSYRNNNLSMPLVICSISLFVGFVLAMAYKKSKTK